MGKDAAVGVRIPSAFISMSTARVGWDSGNPYKVTEGVAVDDNKAAPILPLLRKPNPPADGSLGCRTCEDINPAAFMRERKSMY